MIESAMKAGQDKNIGHEYRKDTESRYREDHRIIVPTPWPAINELIQGGLGNGDLGLFFWQSRWRKIMDISCFRWICC
jgi:hypothetical protein